MGKMIIFLSGHVVAGIRHPSCTERQRENVKEKKRERETRKKERKRKREKKKGKMGES